MEEVGQAAQLRAGELIIIVVVLIMWAGNVPLQQRTLITAGGIRYRKVSEENSEKTLWWFCALQDLWNDMLARRQLLVIKADQSRIKILL